ncbi:3140_t:CDS:2, partial [Acaulospora morrowiae]
HSGFYPSFSTRSSMGDLHKATEQLSLGDPSTVYVDEIQGSDETGTGEREAPYQTLICAFQKRGENIKILIKKESDGDYNDPSGAALKKAKKRVEELAKKAKKLEEQKRLETEKERLLLEEAKKIVLEKDPNLSQAVKIKIRGAVANRGKYVKVSGWVHRIRTQGKDIKFVILRDGTGYLQCVFTGKL